MCGSYKPHLYPERSSPTRLSKTGHASYIGRSCIVSKRLEQNIQRGRVIFQMNGHLTHRCEKLNARTNRLQ